MMRRRDFTIALGAAGASLLLPAGARAQDGDADAAYNDDITASVLNELQLIQGRRINAVGRSNVPGADRSALRINGVDAGFAVPPLTPELRAVLTDKDYWGVTPALRPAPGWAQHAADYQHLGGFPSASPQFELTAGLLNLLAERNAFVINDRRPALIFGLRGCRLVSGADFEPWAATHQLEAIDPNHFQCRCVIGVLRKSDGMIAVFRGSTAPSVAAMFKALPINGAGTSLLPTGLYPYRAGSHWAGDLQRIQRGALLLAGSNCVLRTADDLVFDPYSEGDAWTQGANHNIHAAGLPDRYNSAGCQVIPGGYQQPERTTAIGVWADFRRAAGLVDDEGAPIAPDTRPTFQYMLLTGREAAIAYQHSPAFESGYRRLRPGSSGNAVLDLQTRLFATYSGIEGVHADGSFGMFTAFAVLLRKKDTEGEFTSPIVSL